MTGSVLTLGGMGAFSHDYGVGDSSPRSVDAGWTDNAHTANTLLVQDMVVGFYCESIAVVKLSQTGVIVILRQVAMTLKLMALILWHSIRYPHTESIIDYDLGTIRLSENGK